jgi:hypothetical protein
MGLIQVNNPSFGVITKRFFFTASQVRSMGTSPLQLSNSENWYPFFYGAECRVFTTLYNFSQQIVIKDLSVSNVYFKPGVAMQALQGVGFATSIYATSGNLLSNTAPYLSNPPSFVWTTDLGSDATLGDGDFTIVISGLVL